MMHSGEPSAEERWRANLGSIIEALPEDLRQKLAAVQRLRRQHPAFRANLAAVRQGRAWARAEFQRRRLRIE